VQAGAGLLWVCEGACDVLALLAAGVLRVVAIFRVQGWRWEWAREVRGLVFALDTEAAGQQRLAGATLPLEPHPDVSGACEARNHAGLCGIDDSHDQRKLSEGSGTVSKVCLCIAVAS